MNKVLRPLAALVLLLSGFALTAGPAVAQAVDPAPVGADVTLRNTLQDPGEPEVSFPGLFGLPDDAFDENGTVSNTSSEFPAALAQPGTPFGDISGLYDINMTADSITFTMLPAADDPFWANVFGEFPAGKFDRYYFTFSEPHNIATGLSTNSSVILRVVSSTVVMVEIGEGYDMNPPQSFNITLLEGSGTAAGPGLAVTGADTGTLAVVATTMIAGGAMIARLARRLDGAV